MPEPEVVESGFSPDGAEVALFPDAVRPLDPDEEEKSPDASASPSGSKLTGILIALGVAAAVFGIAFVAFGRRGKATQSLSAPPPSGGSDFRG